MTSITDLDRLTDVMNKLEKAGDGGALLYVNKTTGEIKAISRWNFCARWRLSSNFTRDVKTVAGRINQLFIDFKDKDTLFACDFNNVDYKKTLENFSGRVSKNPKNKSDREGLLNGALGKLDGVKEELRLLESIPPQISPPASPELLPDPAPQPYTRAPVLGTLKFRKPNRKTLDLRRQEVLLQQALNEQTGRASPTTSPSTASSSNIPESGARSPSSAKSAPIPRSASTYSEVVAEKKAASPTLSPFVDSSGTSEQGRSSPSVQSEPSPRSSTVRSDEGSKRFEYQPSQSEKQTEASRKEIRNMAEKVRTDVILSDAKTEKFNDAKSAAEVRIEAQVEINDNYGEVKEFEVALEAPIVVQDNYNITSEGRPISMIPSRVIPVNKMVVFKDPFTV